MWYEMKRTFIDAAARVLWVCAWAYHMENEVCRNCGEPPDAVAHGGGDAEGDVEHAFRGTTFPGEEPTEIAPDTPDYARLEAAMLLGKLEAANGAGLAAIVAHAIRADTYEAGPITGDVPYVSEFAACVALQALGHGVSWYDDHERFEVLGKPFKVPTIEFDYQDYQEEEEES